jgi:hypothetical protein
VTATDPERDIGKEEPTRRSSGAQPDPWGVKRAENLLTSLKGVLSARVIVSPVGEVVEVHVLTHGGTPAKQVVRNVESALLAHLGLKVDHRRISVAQTAEVKPLEALEQSVVKEEALRRGILFTGIEFETGRLGRIRMVVSLQVGGEDFQGAAEAVDNPRARVQGAARAAVAGLDKAMPEGMLEVEGVTVVDAFERTYAFAGVLVAERRGSRLLTGTCEVADSPELAAVLAVLDASNRWLASRF